MLTREYWEHIFAEEDPWGYGKSDYERWKFGLTLALLPRAKAKAALELACAEGHLTSKLAPLVGALTAVDISPTAIARARQRCRDLTNVDFRVLDLVNDPLPGKLDLIVASEVLFYLPLSTLEAVAPKIAASLKPGGHLLLAHGNLIADDRKSTGFDWGHPFGAKTIGKVFAGLDSLDLVQETRTPLFTIHLLRRAPAGKRKPVEPEIVEEPLPFDLTLTPDLEKTILWEGASLTREEARERESATQIPILMYHSIADDGPPELRPYRVTPRAFREQLRHLRSNGYHSVTIADWAQATAEKKPLPGRPIIITFDDGYQDFFDSAWPELERADFSATMFVVTDKVGGVADWDKHSGPPLRLMDWPTLRKLRDSGIVIASHSASHKDLSALPEREAHRECERARRALANELEIEADSLAYPWGRSNAGARRAAARAGYRAAVTTWGGRSSFADDPFALSRIEILGDDDLAAFAKKLTLPSESKAAAEARGGAPAVDEVVGFDAEGGPVAPAGDMANNPEYTRALAARLDALVGEFVRLQTQLLNNAKSPDTLQRRLVGVFAQPVTGRFSRRVAPGEAISPGVRLAYDEDPEVTLTVEPKSDHSLSPESYLNAVRLAVVGSSPSMALEIDLEWRELSAAQRFQLSLYAAPDRQVECQAALRFPRKEGRLAEHVFATFTLMPDDRNAIVSGELSIPDLIELDTTQRPQLLLYFDASSDVAMTLHYFNVYFA